MRSLAGPVTHFYWYWLPEYLKRKCGMSMTIIGLFAGCPFFRRLGSIGGGLFSSWLMGRGWDVDRARWTAFGFAVALCLMAMLVPVVRKAVWAVLFLCLASLGINAFSANLIGVLTDLFPESALAKVGGLRGVGGGLVSMMTMLATGSVTDHLSYRPVFVAVSLLPMLALASLFVLVRKVRPISLAEICRSRDRTPLW